ncbi:hypothetical protein Tco_0888585 [Tanacetum coccineum]
MSNQTRNGNYTSSYSRYPKKTGQSQLLPFSSALRKIKDSSFPMSLPPLYSTIGGMASSFAGALHLAVGLGHSQQTDLPYLLL